MRHEIKKVTLIINEMLTMLLLNGAEEIDVKIKKSCEVSEITFIHRKCKYDNKFIERMKHNLNTQRQHEVEGYYWQLVGDEDNEDEIHLVGAMIDEATVEKSQDDDLYIHMIRRVN